jgi:hypothetical protein
VRESETKSPVAYLREDQEAGPCLLSLVEVILIDSSKSQEKRELREYWDLFEMRWKSSKMVGAWMQRPRVNFYNHFRLVESADTCWSILQMSGVAGMVRQRLNGPKVWMEVIVGELYIARCMAGRKRILRVLLNM